ncbi:MAG: putative DNA modification/repair radical SAM protein [Candidatus Altiarchaeota archaeon]
MDTLEKVRILGEAGKWDTCASSASPRKVTTSDRIGDASSCGICHSFTEDGRCVSLFKTLLTNDCSYDCKYCQNSVHCSKNKVSYEPDELARVFMHLYLGNYVEGLFLSSGISGDPDVTMERMLDTVRLIRGEYMFQGYVHFKILPGCSREMIRQAGEMADRLSINIEVPSKSRMAEISDVKDYRIDILRRQKWVSRENTPSGQTTQMVVGGCGETDREILGMAGWEYDKMRLRRVYYSAFTPIELTPFEYKSKTPLEREHRLYQVDFMMRKYGIGLREFREVFEDGNLPRGDPKVHLARITLDGHVDVNEASYNELVRVPGIGPKSAVRILQLRKNNRGITSRRQLDSIGVVLKRAEPFLKVGGHVQARMSEYA